MTQATESAPLSVHGAKLWPLSVPAYHVLGEAGLIPENTELLYGFVYTKMPKSPLHTTLVMRLLRMIAALLPAPFIARPEQPITCADSEPEPDLAVVPGPDEKYSKAHPTTAEFVVEVCVTSVEYDRSKLRAYALAGVRECWLLLVQEQRIEIFREPMSGDYSIHETSGPGGTISCAAIPAITLRLEDIFKV
jgi:Uma2 family endonuclease